MLIEIYLGKDFSGKNTGSKKINKLPLASSSLQNPSGFIAKHRALLMGDSLI